MPLSLDISSDVDNEKPTDANGKKIFETVNDQKITDASPTVAADASWKLGEKNSLPSIRLSISICTSLQ